MSNSATESAEDWAVLKKLFLILGAILLLVVVIGYRLNVAFERFSNVEHQFVSIHAGDSQESVKAKIGPPSRYSGTCGTIGVARKGCASEWVYSDPLAPINPHYYVVSFSADDHVVSAEEWASP